MDVLGAIDRRKNDMVRKGHYPALGRSKDPALDIVAQLRTWLRVAGLAVHRACAKRTRPAARCEVCPPLFPLTRCAQGGTTVVTDRQQASDWIRWSTRFSGISARKGGISAAIEARVRRRGDLVPAERPRSSLPCPHLTSLDRFLETFEAFGL